MVDATRPVEFLFAADATGKLELAARIEATRIGKEPFVFPAANLYKPAARWGASYKYTLGAGDGRLTGEPLFAEPSVPGSGHPVGVTRGWVGDDGTRLVARVDFTSDNTRDGDADYCAVWAKTPAGWREFRVGESLARYGSVSFKPTANAAYRHKVYDFSIPLAELSAAPGGKVELAFTAYGTASAETGKIGFVLAYATVAKKSLLVYAANTVAPFSIRGQLLDEAGASSGAEITLTTNCNELLQYPKVAYDPSRDRFLAVWRDDRVNGIGGQFVGADGTLAGDNLFIVSTNGNQAPSSIAYLPGADRYLVLWSQGSTTEVWGRFLDGAGIPVGASFAVAAYGLGDDMATVAADPVAQRFLVTWRRVVSGNNTAWARTCAPDGTLGTAWQFNAALTMDPVAVPTPSGWLAAWYKSLGQPYARPLAADGISLETPVELSVSSVADAVALAWTPTGRIFAAWATSSGLGQLFGGELAPHGEVPRALGTLAASAYGNYAPHVVYQANAKSWLCAYLSTGSSPYAVSFAVIPLGNAPPTRPVPVSPVNGAVVGTSPALTFTPSTDAEGDALTYRVICSTTSNFTTSTTNLASAGSGNGTAAAGFPGGLVAGLVAAAGACAALRRREVYRLLAALLVLAAVAMACSSDAGTTVPPSTDKVVTVSGLAAGTTYYWKVQVTDGVNAVTSRVASFATAP